MNTSKRALDVALSFVGLVIGLPIMLLIALLVRIDSPGHVIFSQRRIGKGGRYFNIHKFRKFPFDWGSKGAGVTTQGDVRMTSFGAFLERTKLDELPQLWNILKGEMSFVGPRPESVQYESLFAGEYQQLLDYTPGIFGPNQVAFRNESEMYPVDMDPDEFYRNELFPKKARVDIDYFSNSSFFQDVGWIFKSTLGTLFGIFNWQRIYNRYALILLLDFLLFQIAWFVAHIIRFEGMDLSPANMSVYQTGAWLIPLLIFPIMLAGGCYRHPVRYFGLPDAMRLVLVGVSAWTVALFIQFGFFQRNTSVGIAILSLLVFLAFLLVPRLWRRERWVFSHPTSIQETRKILIVGAGTKGGALAKFLDQGFNDAEPVGFIDEDPELRGRHINGLRVLGSWRDRDAILARYTEISEIWLSETSSNPSAHQIEQWAEGATLKFTSITGL